MARFWPLNLYYADLRSDGRLPAVSFEVTQATLGAQKFINSGTVLLSQHMHKRRTFRCALMPIGLLNSNHMKCLTYRARTVGKISNQRLTEWPWPLQFKKCRFGLEGRFCITYQIGKSSLLQIGFHTSAILPFTLMKFRSRMLRENIFLPAPFGRHSSLPLYQFESFLTPRLMA